MAFNCGIFMKHFFSQTRRRKLLRRSTSAMTDLGCFEVEHKHRLSECFGRLLFDAETSDLTLIVEGEVVPAHRIILASSCHYFRYFKSNSFC